MTDHEDEEQGTFTLRLLEALKDSHIGNELQRIFSASHQQLSDQVAQLNQSVTSLRNQLKLKDETIEKLQTDVDTLHTRCDQLEQYSRRDAVRIYGIPEEGTGSTDDKVLHLANHHLKMEPKMRSDEIAVSHRAGKPDRKTGIRPILVKFVSRRTKTQLMRTKSKLRYIRATAAPTSQEETSTGPNPNPDPNAQPANPVSDTTSGTSEPVTSDATASAAESNNSQTAMNSPLPFTVKQPIYIEDDLTKARAELAFAARLLKRQEHIAKTWVFDTRVMIQDNHGHVHEVTSRKSLERYK